MTKELWYGSIGVHIAVTTLGTKTMGYREKRKIIKMGQSSKGIVLPKPWFDYHGEAIDEVTLLGDSIIVIATKEDEDKARKLMDSYERESSNKS